MKEYKIYRFEKISGRCFSVCMSGLFNSKEDDLKRNGLVQRREILQESVLLMGSKIFRVTNRGH